MIALQKGNEPQILVNNGVAWTQTLLNRAAAGQTPTQTEATRYRHPQIKAALVAETNNKCAYCESKLQHIHHGDVEHIFPKSLDLSKIFSWSNLTLACEVCNQNKSDLDPNANEIIDPYVENPRSHLVFSGPLIFSLGTAAGIATKQILDLDRVQLIEQRRERLKYIMSIYSEVLRNDVPLPARRAIYKNLVNTEAAPTTAYSAMTLDVIASMREHIPPEVAK